MAVRFVEPREEPRGLLLGVIAEQLQSDAPVLRLLVLRQGSAVLGEARQENRALAHLRVRHLGW